VVKPARTAHKLGGPSLGRSGWSGATRAARKPRWALVDGEIVGNAGLHSAGKSPRRAHVMHLGMTVREEWQGKGVGTALMRALTSLADGWLNVFRIELTVYTDNERALALYRKFGFVVEGTHKAYALRGGRYVDSHSMARVKPKTSPV